MNLLRSIFILLWQLAHNYKAAFQNLISFKKLNNQYLCSKKSTANVKAVYVASNLWIYRQIANCLDSRITYHFSPSFPQTKAILLACINRHTRHTHANPIQQIKMSSTATPCTHKENECLSIDTFCLQKGCHFVVEFQQCTSLHLLLSHYLIPISNLVHAWCSEPQLSHTDGLQRVYTPM